ncbi:MAG: tetratricopeptide repeat protein, partial [Phycisphaerales bacterium]|nr:tetratricopeptide repeat protein [Phycisphaerales bacterium]
RSLTALGLLRADQSRLPEADSLARLGLGIMRRRDPPDPAGVGRAATALGLVLEVKGEYEPAIALLSEALRAHALPGGGTDMDRSAALTELVNCHFYSGRYAVADSLNRIVLELDRRLYGERHPHVAGDLITIGAIQQEGGHHEEAEATYRQALDIYRDWYGTNHYETASTLTMVGRELVQQGKPAEAAGPLREALGIRERIYGPNHPNVASTLNELGLLAQNQGNLDEAEICFQRMIEIYRVAYDDRHYLIGLACANLAGVHQQRKDYAGAEKLFREAKRRYAETLPADHLYMAVARLKLGRALLLQKRYAEAEPESRGGYESLMKQPDPAENWLKNARNDLVAAYEALGDTAQAGRFRREMAQAAAKAAAGATQ